jgi:murein DD-endopeptidase MepM/ murein hydrolase activator NlpD
MGSGQYQPTLQSGQQILGHELTHVVQQGEGRTSGKVQQQKSNESNPIDTGFVGNHSLFQRIQRLTNPLSDMSTFQSPGASGWRGAKWGCYRNSCTKKHKGWDVHAAVGSECKATVAGTTSHASQRGGYGKYVILTSSADATKKYIYAHMGSRETVGSVAEAAKVGEVGTSGNASSTRPHLHFTVKESGTKVDPDGKGFTKPTKFIEASGSTATAYNSADPDPCEPCAM